MGLLQKLWRFANVELWLLLIASALYGQYAAQDFSCRPNPHFSSAFFQFVDGAVGSVAANLPVTMRYADKMTTAGYGCKVALITHVFSVNVILLFVWLPVAALKVGDAVRNMSSVYRTNSALGETTASPGLGFLLMLASFGLAFGLWIFGNMQIPATSTSDNRLYEDTTYLVVDSFSITAMVGFLKYAVAFLIAAIRSSRD